MQISTFYLQEKSLAGKNLGVALQLVLRAPPSPSLFPFIICLPFVPRFQGILEGLGGSGRVWWFACVSPSARRGCPVP